MRSTIDRADDGDDPGHGDTDTSGGATCRASREHLLDYLIHDLIGDAF